MEESENRRHILLERRHNQQGGNRLHSERQHAESCDRVRIKGRFFNYSIINVHCPHEERSDDEKEAFYAKLE